VFSWFRERQWSLLQVIFLKKFLQFLFFLKEKKKKINKAPANALILALAYAHKQALSTGSIYLLPNRTRLVSFEQHVSINFEIF
jgi:hypothetical protein